MDVIFLVIVLAITVEGLVEYAKSFEQLLMEGARRALIIQLGALLGAVFLCLATGADVYAYLGVQFALPWVGTALTGVFVSRGTNYISDLIGRLRNGGGIVELATGVELLETDEKRPERGV